MNIICFGQQNWDVCWSAKQQLLTRLVRRGHRVLYVDPVPDASHTSLRARLAALAPARSGLGIRRIQDGLHVFTPPVAHALPRGVRQRLARRVIGSVAERLGLWAPVAICCWPAQRWLMDGLKPAAKLYLAFDDNASFSGLPEDFAEHQRRQERQLLEECDVALAVSPTLVEKFRQIQPRSYLQENGVDLDEFSPVAIAAVDPHPALAALPRPRIGFVGQIDERLDQDLVVALARRLPQAAIVLAGRIKDRTDVSRLRAEPNVLLTGFVDYQQLAGVYRELDVGLVPYVSSPLTQACNPLKVYEYLAADLPTVATDLAGLNSTRDAIEVASSHEEFIAAVERAIREPDRLRPHRRAVAESASWQQRADQLEERLREALSVASARRKEAALPEPRPDRHGRQVVRVEPRLDGKDASVRLLHDNYLDNDLSRQQYSIYLLSRLLGLGYSGARRLGRLLRRDRATVRRILVVRNGHLGDTVVFFPTLLALRQRFPEATVTVAVAPGGGAGKLLEASPYVDEVLVLDFFNRSRRERFAGALRLLRRGFDLVIGGAWYFHLPEAVFSGAPLRLGLYDGHPLQRYADRVVMLDPNLHEAENNLLLVELLTGAVPPEQRVPLLQLDEPNLKERAAEVRQRLGLAPDALVVAMHPGSKRPSRRWPAERFAELAEMLLAERPELHVVFTGAGDEEQELTSFIRSRIPANLRGRAHDAVGKGDLTGIIGFYDTCRLLVCNDTGVMHVARARGVPLVAVIGPENDRRWGPHPLGPAPAITVRQQVPGTPHGKWDCEWNLSLGSIQPARVKGHVDALLDGRFEQQYSTAPVRLGESEFYPLVRDVSRLSFAQVAELGLRVPKVAVIIPQDPRLLGYGGEAVSSEDLATAARGLRRQLYPALQTLLVTQWPQALEGLDLGDATVVPVPPEDPDAAWAATLARTDAGLFLPARPQVRLSPSSVANRVAVFIRGPLATVVDEDRAWPMRQIVNNDLLSGEWLIERQSLEELLEHPIYLPRAAQEADLYLPLETAIA